MADGAIKRQGDSLAPQGVVCNVVRSANISGLAPGAVIPYDQAKFDPFGFWNPSTYRFTPKIAGYYQVTAQVTLNPPADPHYFDVHLRKNGTSIAVGREWASSSAAGDSATPSVTTIVYLNGTTDYLDVIYQVAIGGTRTVHGDSTWPGAFFSAALIGHSVGVIPEPWHNVGATGEPAFVNGWTNYNASSYQPLRFFKDPHGMVHFMGVVGASPVSISSTTMVTLPAGYRPSMYMEYPLRFWNGTSNVLGILAIGSNGVVNLYGSTNNTPSGNFVASVDIHYRGEQ